MNNFFPWKFVCYYLTSFRSGISWSVPFPQSSPKLASCDERNWNISSHEIDLTMVQIQYQSKKNCGLGLPAIQKQKYYKMCTKRKVLKKTWAVPSHIPNKVQTELNLYSEHIRTSPYELLFTSTQWVIRSLTETWRNNHILYFMSTCLDQMMKEIRISNHSNDSTSSNITDYILRNLL